MTDPYAACSICTESHCCICEGDATVCPVQPHHPQGPADIAQLHELTETERLKAELASIEVAATAALEEMHRPATVLEAVEKVIRQRDGLGRRCALRFAEAEKLRAELAEVRTGKSRVGDGINRRDWTHQQWLGEARTSFYGAFGSAGDLLNGHVSAMWAELARVNGLLLKGHEMCEAEQRALHTAQEWEQLKVELAEAERERGLLGRQQQALLDLCAEVEHDGANVILTPQIYQTVLHDPADAPSSPDTAAEVRAVAIEDENDRLHKLVDDLRQQDSAERAVIEAAKAAERAWVGSGTADNPAPGAGGRIVPPLNTLIKAVRALAALESTADAPEQTAECGECGSPMWQDRFGGWSHTHGARDHRARTEPEDGWAASTSDADGGGA